MFLFAFLFVFVCVFVYLCLCLCLYLYLSLCACVVVMCDGCDVYDVCVCGACAVVADMNVWCDSERFSPF